jgi:hypothetical protein
MQFAIYLNKGSSSWRFKEVKSLTAHVDMNIPSRSSSYKYLPEFVKDKKAVITCSALALSTVLRTTSLSYGNMPFSGTHPTKVT